MRGRTLNDSFIVLDEAQNTSPEQMKMFLTRLGFGSKIVVTGDVTQVDLPGGMKSGLRVVEGILDERRGRLVPAAHRPRRGPAPAGRQDRGGVRRVRRPQRGRAPIATSVTSAVTAPERTQEESQMSIEVLNESGHELDVRELARLSRFVMDVMRVHPQAELCIKAVDEATIAELNAQWMEKAGPDRRARLPDGRAAARAWSTRTPRRACSATW